MNEQIIAAGAEDLPALEEHFRAYYRELEALGARYALNEERLGALLEAQVRSRLVCVLKAETAEGEFAGFLIASVSRLPGEYLDGTLTGVGFLHHLYVAPGFRRSGLAKRLCAAAEDWARAAGVRSLTLDVLVRNEAAMALYQSLGFQSATVTLCKRVDAEA